MDTLIPFIFYFGVFQGSGSGQQRAPHGRGKDHHVSKKCSCA